MTIHPRTHSREIPYKCNKTFTPSKHGLPIHNEKDHIGVDIVTYYGDPKRKNIAM